MHSFHFIIALFH